MRAKRLRAAKALGLTIAPFKEVHAEIPSTTAIDLVHESGMDCVISER
jgi:hypothetical protein